MANTRSAKKQARASERRRTHNKAIKSRLHTLEARFVSTLQGGKAEDAALALRAVASALDKAAKTQIIARNLANRKKSRLAAQLRKLSKAA